MKMGFLDKTKKVLGLAAVTVAVGAVVKKLTSQESPKSEVAKEPEKISKAAKKPQKNK